MLKGHETEYKSIKATMLRVDKTYQRDLRQSRVAKIVKEFDPDLVNEPKVSIREDGSYFIFNGQHTVAALKSVYGKDSFINCKVFRGLTWQEEKNLFVKQNGISKDPTTNEKLRAEYNDKNVSVVSMVEAAADAGVTVDFSNKQGAYKCISTAALYSAYKKVGKTMLTEMLTVLAGAFEGEPLSFSAGFIKGMSEFYKRHYGTFTASKLKKALSSHTPEYYVREAADMNGSMESRFYSIIFRAYNKGKSVGKLTMEEVITSD